MAARTEPKSTKKYIFIALLFVFKQKSIKNF